MHKNTVNMGELVNKIVSNNKKGQVTYIFLS